MGYVGERLGNLKFRLKLAKIFKKRPQNTIFGFAN